MIKFQSVSKKYDSAPDWAVKDLTLEVNRGEIVVLVGESGCGKSSSLRMVNRLVEPTEGEIFVNGRPVTELNPIELRRSIGYVIQQVGLFPHLTVAQNIGLIPRLLKWSEIETEKRIDQLLELVGLNRDDFKERNVSTLSGGQQQRIGFARALAGKPEVLLMDEPFGALDPITRFGLVEQFSKIQKELGVTVLMVTHDISEAIILGDRIAVMKEGRKLNQGRPEDLFSKANHPYTQQLFDIARSQVTHLINISKRESER